MALPSPGLAFWTNSPIFSVRNRGITTSKVALVRGWVRRRTGLSPLFTIEHVNGKNRVLLRLEMNGLRMVAEVGQLYELRSRQPKAAQEMVLALFVAVA